jgi:hypothetical protein
VIIGLARRVSLFLKKVVLGLKKILSAFDLQDVFCFGGLAMIGVGLWYWDFRVALVVVGMVLMVMGKGVLIMRASKGEREEGKA